jgi:protein-S-isoprenylcysteine O-methyltransferase Ste14
MKLIPNWRDAWRWFSVQALAAIIALPIVWASLPSDIKSFVPDSWDRWVFVAIAAAGLLGRLIDQNKAPTA